MNLSTPLMVLNLFTKKTFEIVEQKILWFTQEQDSWFILIYSEVPNKCGPNNIHVGEKTSSWDISCVDEKDLRWDNYLKKIISVQHTYQEAQSIKNGIDFSENNSLVVFSWNL